MGRCGSKSKTPPDNSTMIIILVVVVCCCCAMSIVGGIAAYFMFFTTTKRKAGTDKTLFEYKDAKGSHIIKDTDLPFTLKDAYYLNLPLGTRSYKFVGKACLDDVCDDINWKNTPALNIFYDDADGNLLSGIIEYLPVTPAAK